MTRSRFTTPSKALGWYRVMALLTGVVLLAGTIALLVQYVGGVGSLHGKFRWLWVAHGYLYLVYLVATLNLGVTMRWNLARMGLVALAGTVPTMSFVAEHFVTREVRATVAATRSTQTGEPISLDPR